MTQPSFPSRFFRHSLLWLWPIAGMIAWLLASRSIGDTDQGFIQGLAWRIFRGESIYTDFDYVRPPFSVWFHSIWFSLPKGLDLLAGRIFMVLQLFTMVVVMVRTLEIQSKPLPYRPFVVLMLFFLAIHNFPTMPWHTVDGLFWTSLGLWLLSRDHWWRVLLGVAFLWLAAMCKQSFFPVPVLGLLMLLMMNPQRWTRNLILSLAVPLAAVLGVQILVPSFFSEMLAGISGASSLQDLLQVGVIQYVPPLIFVIIIIGLRHILERLTMDRLRSWIYPWILTAILAVWGGELLILGENMPMPFRMAHILWWLSLYESIRIYREHRNLSLIWLAMLGLAWCSSLSWGYATPVLCSVPIWWGLLRELPKPIIPTTILTLLAANIVLLGYVYPYREVNEFQPQDPQVVSEYPRLAYITPGPERLSELHEIQQIRDSIPGTFAVLPNHPLIHCLTETDNPLPVDWAHNAEMHFSRNPAPYIQALRSCDYILVDKDRISRAAISGKYGSALLKYTLEQGINRGETPSFLIIEVR